MGDVSGHPLFARTSQGGGARRGDLVGKISRSTAAGCAWIGPANAAASATLGRLILLFFGHSRTTHTSFPPFLDPLNSFPWSFFMISHRLKDTTKTSLVDDWIEFSGHHSNFWTKVRVLPCSWSLGLSVNIKFLNFRRRLVSFPFLGHLG